MTASASAVTKHTGRPPWVAPVLWLIAVPNVLTGTWALLDPSGWFEQFPGLAPRLVAAYPPFNEHLATDAGAGVLTVGVLAGAALIVDRTDGQLVAGAGLAAFTVPHALFHLLNPSELLAGGENAMSTVPLVVTAVASVALLLDAVRRAR